MKKTPLFLFTCIILLFTSCSKPASTDDPVTPSNPDNVVNAKVGIKNDPFFTLAAKASNTVFTQRTDPNGEFVITILGSDSHGTVHITLVNITSPGTYSLNTGTTSVYAFCTYEIGNPVSGPFELYSSTSTAPPSGSVVITNLSSAGIKGSFTATCTSSSGVVEINSGSFQGNFE